MYTLEILSPYGTSQYLCLEDLQFLLESGYLFPSSEHLFLQPFIVLLQLGALGLGVPQSLHRFLHLASLLLQSL